MKLFGNSSKQISDEEIIARYRETGNAAVLDTIFNRYAGLVYGVCLKYMKNTAVAEDETMAIFEKLITDLQKHEVACFKAWFYKYARNHCLMELRKTRPQITEFNCELSTHIPDQNHISEHEQEAMIEQKYSIVQSLIRFLKPEQQVCLKEFYNNNRSYRDVSLLTGFSLKEVKSHIQNGKRNLRIHFEKLHSKHQNYEDF